MGNVPRILPAGAKETVLSVSIDSSLDTSKTHVFSFGSDEVLGEIVVDGKNEFVIHESQRGTATQTTRRRPMEFSANIQAANDTTNYKLRRMEYLLSGQCKVTVSLPSFIGFIYSLEHAGAPPFTTVYPVAGDLAYINGSTTATTLGIAQSLAWTNQAAVAIPITMQCTVKMPRQQDYMGQIKGLGVAAFDSYTIKFLESRPLTLPLTPSGGAVLDDGGIIGSGA